MAPTRRWVLGGLAGVMVGGALAARPLLGIRRLPPRPAGTPQPLVWSEWSAFLAKHVRGGAVDWEKATQNVARVEEMYSSLATWGPRTAPDAFPTPDSRLAYAINAYNLLVIVAVLRNWPLARVGEVDGIIEPSDHFGFFYGLRLRVDGEWVSLYRYERAMFAQWPDSRIHAAINCASASCPPLVATAFLPATLDAQLDGACRDWLSTPGVVRIDEDSRQLVLPPLLGLYPGEFGAAASDAGWGASDLDWVLHWLPEPRATELRARVTQGYAIQVPPYDWALSQPP